MRVFDDEKVRSRSEEPGVFAFSRLRRTTAKLVRGIAPRKSRTTRLERTRGERDETKTREDRAFASAGVGRHRAAFAATRGSSGARSALPRSTRELVPRRGRRFRHAPKSSHTSHDRRTPRMGKSPHRSHEWHSSRPCKHGSNIGSRSHGRTRSRRESGGALRADEPRACVPRPGRRERLCRDQCATAHAFIVRLRSRLGQRPRTNASKRGAVHCMGKQSESCSARIFEKTRRRSFAWKKVGVHIGVPSGDALRRAGLPTSGAGFRAFRAYAGTVRVARRSRLERTSSLRRVRGTSSTERPQGTPPPPPPRCRAPALTPCSARRRRSS
jgi:hypothetical protein